MRNSAHPITNKQKLSFTFNGKKYFGYKGDTLASALIANNVKPVSYTHLTLPTKDSV